MNLRDMRHEIECRFGGCCTQCQSVVNAVSQVSSQPATQRKQMRESRERERERVRDEFDNARERASDSACQKELDEQHWLCATRLSKSRRSSQLDLGVLIVCLHV